MPLSLFLYLSYFPIYKTLALHKLDLAVFDKKNPPPIKKLTFCNLNIRGTLAPTNKYKIFLFHFVENVFYQKQFDETCFRYFKYQQDENKKWYKKNSFFKFGLFFCPNSNKKLCFRTIWCDTAFINFILKNVTQWTQTVWANAK